MNIKNYQCICKSNEIPLTESPTDNYIKIESDLDPVLMYILTKKKKKKKLETNYNKTLILQTYLQY